MHVSDEIAGYWNDYADAYDAEPDHGLGDPATREAWRRLLARWRSLLRPGGRFLLVEVVPLTEPVLWGKEIADERYLLVADLSQKATPAL